MSTISRCEQVIKNHFREISKIRIYPTTEDYVMNVYYEDIHGNFNDSLIPYIEEILPCHLHYNFKPFSETLKDNIPEKPKVSEFIENLALKSNNNLKSFTDVAERAFYDLRPITINVLKNSISIETNQKISASDMENYNSIAQEIAPIGCKINLICKS